MISQFHVFARKVNERLNALAKGELFTVQLDAIYEHYIFAFPDGTNPIFRTRTEHECSCCKQFIRNFGRVVGIDSQGEIQTIWDVADLPHPYNIVAARLHELVKQQPISGVFRTKEGSYGAQQTHEERDGSVITWHHFWGVVDRKHRNSQPQKVIGEKNSSFQVLKRGLEELTVGAVNTVLELIEANALYRGGEFRNAVMEFAKIQRDFQKAKNQDTFVWLRLDSPAARFRNTAIGTLVQDLSEGMDLDKAVRMFEAKVAPLNYKRTTALITPKMVEQAKEKLAELDLEHAIERRMARAMDISVNDVLFTDASIRAVMPGNDPWEGLAKAKTSKPKGNVTDATIAGFLGYLAENKPKKMEVFVSNKHLGNFVTLTAPVHPSTGRLFKWKNDFAWSYDGEVADSIKAKVKKAGGNINAALRVSLAWSNYDDLDIHAQCPDGHVFYGNRMGILDIDMNAGGHRSRDPVENLAWLYPKNGTYKIWVNQFSKRENVDFGFTLELECNGEIQQWSFPKPVTGDVQCLTFRIEKGVLKDLVIGSGLVGGGVSTKKWGIDTETFVPVSIFMASPNHWENAGEIGNKHLFFMLQGCKNPDPVRGIYNEFLRGDLDPHRKVFEILGSRTKCEPTDDQLSGLGFSFGRGDQVTVKLDNRTFNIQF